jgi:hypothetical protein
LAGQLLEQQHYLGDCPAGRQLLQVIEYQGHWVALLDWGPACWKLADREAHIGWTHQQRAQRLGLVVQNRRFLVLGQERMPNLEGATVTGDALNNNKPQAHAITQAAGHYFLQLKNENRHAYKAADRLAQEGSPLLPTQKNPTPSTDASINEA